MKNVKVICYGDIESIERDKAIKLYSGCVKNSFGNERDRYVNVLMDLLDGYNLAWDGVEIPKGYHRCMYCNGIAVGEDKDRLCKYCQVAFGHSLFSEL